MDSFCREQPSLLPPIFAMRRAQGESLKDHCISLWRVLAQESPSCIYLLFLAVLSPTECDTQGKRQRKLSRVRDVRSTIIKNLIKETCSHQVVPGSLTSKEDLWRVAHLYVWVRVVQLTWPLHELCYPRQTQRRKTCQSVHMNIVYKQQPGPSSRPRHSMRFGLLLWTPGGISWTPMGYLADTHTLHLSFQLIIPLQWRYLYYHFMYEEPEALGVYSPLEITQQTIITAVIIVTVLTA